MFNKQLLSSQQSNKIPWQQIVVKYIQRDGDDQGCLMSYNTPIYWGDYTFTYWQWGKYYDNEHFQYTCEPDVDMYVLSRQALQEYATYYVVDCDHFPDTPYGETGVAFKECTVGPDWGISRAGGYYNWFMQISYTDGKFPKVGDVHDVYITTERPYWMSSY